MSDPRGAKYHQIGTGRTRSDFFCPDCDGWYGVPHSDFEHDNERRRHVEHCCCALCLTPERRKDEGVTMTHALYLILWERTPPDERYKLTRNA